MKRSTFNFALLIITSARIVLLTASPPAASSAPKLGSATLSVSAGGAFLTSVSIETINDFYALDLSP